MADIEALDEEGFTPLGCFSESSASCVDLLLANGANMKAAKNPKKLTPLHLAAQAGNARVVELLLARARRRSSDFMVEYNEAKLEKKNAKKEWKNAKGFTKEEYGKLLTEFSNIVNAKSSSSRTPLDYAAEGNWKTVEGILRDNMGHSGTYLGKVVRGLKNPYGKCTRTGGHASNASRRFSPQAGSVRFAYPRPARYTIADELTIYAMAAWLEATVAQAKDI
ncbi:hypothetical protein MMC22_002636 [Lobaria immixta]|nr:hypothetical protein [Lobaria immixta]